jgi:esterase/lipase superfamily enzyme
MLTTNQAAPNSDARKHQPADSRLSSGIRLSIMAITLTMTLLLASCRSVLMATPAVVSVGSIDPFELVLEERQNSQAPVFIASARKPSGKNDPARFYTTKRSREVCLGRAVVGIGPGMSWDELTAESLVDKRKKNPSVKLDSYEEYGPLWSTFWPPDYKFNPNWRAPDIDHAPGDRFVEEINDMLSSSGYKQITIYVHGFNTTFEKNTIMAGEFWHFMGRDGVMLSFDWASEGSVFTYQVDKANANFAIRQLRRLLEFLAENTSVEEINILAHSAGNPVVIETLRQISLMHYDLDDEEARRRSSIGRVVLAAPDMDLDTAISAGIDGAGRVTQGLVIYASRADKALKFASGIFNDVRLGNSIGKLTDEERDMLIKNNAPWIDVTRAQKQASSFLGHSYYHQNPWVSSDVMLFLRFGATAEERGLVRDMETGFLQFPDDYEENLPEMAENLMTKYSKTEHPESH